MNYNYKEIVPYLMDWFQYNARVLPWRDNPQPYYVWVSEIMLQQTRVEAVKGYFERFIEALPNVEALANAKEDRLLKLWEGLGYYNRVRNMQKAAQVVIKEYDGIIPSDYEKLIKLPGIGSYTAGAISSIAYQNPSPAVDGNVLRVTKRIAGSFDDITKEKVKKELWLDLKEIYPAKRPGDFTQSLMELGAMICIPNGKPLCEKCPVMHLCQAFKKDLTEKIPVKPAKNKRRLEDKTVFILEYQGKYAIRKRGSKGLLAGLWELVNVDEKYSRDKLIRYLEDKGYETEYINSLGETKHIFSHIEWHMLGYYIKLHKLPKEDENLKEVIWVSKQDISEKYSLPTAFQTVWRAPILSEENTLNL